MPECIVHARVSCKPPALVCVTNRIVIVEQILLRTDIISGAPALGVFKKFRAAKRATNTVPTFQSSRHNVRAKLLKIPRTAQQCKSCTGLLSRAANGTEGLAGALLISQNSLNAL